MSAALQSTLPGSPSSAATARPDYLTITQVGKRFGSFTALRDVNLTIGQGEFVSFLGPSGCGKTTLLRAIAGLDLPSEGRIVQGGRDVTALPPGARDFGIVFQSYALFPNLTVSENVGYGLRGAAWPRARRADRVAELIGIVGLQAHAGKYPAQLSGGQQQRVALARALANEPSLLLLDEPLSALDAIVRVHLREEIWMLQRRLGVTTIMVTHDQEEALAVSDRVVVMSAGQVEQVGTPEEIYSSPASLFVAGFVGRSTALDAAVDGEAGVLVRGSLRLGAEGARGLPHGMPVRVLIRPEDVHLAEPGQPGAVPAAVTDVEFLGPFCRVELNAGSTTLQADVPTATVRRLRLAEGAPVAVTLPADRVLVYPAGA